MNNSLKIMLIDSDPTMHIYHKIMTNQVGISEDSLSDYSNANTALADLIRTMEQEGEEALPDAILMDINLPDKNAWEFVKELKSHIIKPIFPKIYIISDSEDPIDRKKAKASHDVIDLKPKYAGRAFYETIARIEKRVLVS